MSNEVYDSIFREFDGEDEELMKEDEEMQEDFQNEESEDIQNEDRDKIRQELSNMSFEDIQKLKEKIGSRLYNETISGQKRKIFKNEFKRANKNRPREESSKIRFRRNTNLIKKPIPRDPRFDTLCGEYDDKSFKANYKFINNIRKNERKKLEEELQETEDSERKKQIKYLIQRMDNQIREQDKKDKAEQIKNKEKSEISEKKILGEKVLHKRKSEKKIGSLIRKYEELKETNKLQKHIEKRSKKLSVKGRKEKEQIKH